MKVYFVLVTFAAISVKCTSGLLCYSCDGLTNNNECFNVTKCPSSEKCYGRAGGLPTSEIRHTTGCTESSEIPKRTDNLGVTFCTQSCSEDLCNLKKCQLGNKVRGPRCLACDLVDTPIDCHNVVECQTNEMCFAEKVSVFNKIQYRIGCVKREHCDPSPKASISPVGKRATTGECSLCCDSDHCNVFACSSHRTGQVFQLQSMSSGAVCVDTDSVMCGVLSRLNADACKESYVVKTCPKSCATCDHVGWGTWQSWGSCSSSCGGGARTRTRVCNHRIAVAKQQSCVGNAKESISGCNNNHCPVDGGWCYEQHLVHTCGTCTHLETQRAGCGCPSPAYGGKGCR